MKSNQFSKFTSELNNSTLFTHKPITSSTIEKLEAYYRTVLKWNEFIPLTTITAPTEFAQKHILESIFAETFINEAISEIWDIGTGLGIPGIPISILRPESKIFLIEANKKKSIFLKEVAHELQLSNIKVLNERFESLPAFSNDSCVISRALDDLKHLLPKILTSAIDSQNTILLGTSELLAKTENLINTSNHHINTHKIPNSTDRLVISITRCT